FFKTPEHLASLVGPAVHLWGNNQVALDILSSSALAHMKNSERAERETRLRAMIADHKGFMCDRLASFVGRRRELEEIHQRIATILVIGGYVVITVEAGEGRSGMIGRVVDGVGSRGAGERFSMCI